MALRGATLCFPRSLTKNTSRIAIIYISNRVPTNITMILSLFWMNSQYQFIFPFESRSKAIGCNFIPGGVIISPHCYINIKEQKLSSLCPNTAWYEGVLWSAHIIDTASNWVYFTICLFDSYIMLHTHHMHLCRGACVVYFCWSLIAVLKCLVC